jgi:Zn-dependent M28 family amino/carboxypeptidase
LLLSAAAYAQTRQEQDVMKRVTEQSLRTNIAFLASDALEGRATPSIGLDKAADYIAAQFKQAGLNPVNGSYFQVAKVADLPRLRPPAGAPETVRNVVGILPGADKKLRDTYLIVSGHYDHLRAATSGEDRIFNGANDDASGTASVIEIARALAKAKPKRSILFMTFFGEEAGLLGSRYYGAHPLVPLEQTIAQVNLEQMGRTDASNGPQIKGANITGFDFSDVTTTLVDAAKVAGVRIWKDAAASDRYFSLSDNQSLADVGIPAHTVSVAYDFADYHKVSDTADKIDYANMAIIDRAIALGVLRLATSPEVPHWSAAYPAAAKYATAYRKLHPTAE